MGTRAELEAGFEHYQATVRRAHAEQDWRLFAGLFTIDAKYNEHAYGRFAGRDSIAEWAIRTMTTFPGNAMIEFPVSWAAFAIERDWIVCEIQDRKGTRLTSSHANNLS